MLVEIITVLAGEIHSVETEDNEESLNAEEDNVKVWERFGDMTFNEPVREKNLSHVEDNVTNLGGI
jgi:hypothetical protein